MAEEIGNLRTRLSFESTGESNLTDLKRDLRGVKSEMNNFRSTSRAYRTSTKGMKRESGILTSQLKVQEERVRELRRRYDESRRATGENSAKTKDLAAQYNNAQAEANKTRQQLDRLNEMIRIQESRWTTMGDRMIDAGDKMQRIGGGLSTFGRTMTRRVTAPVLGLAAGALKVGLDFEEGMSKVQAISGATGSELEELEAQAREMGATTRFSATDAASGMEYLAMAGFDTQEIMDTMPGLLDLAASSGMELGRAADVASNILSGFNYEADEAGRVSDVLAKGASTANTDVEQLGGAMEYAAPVASTLGLDIEGLTASVGFMSNAGIQGTKAGRSLRQGLLRLADPTGKAADLIEELGINVFDSDGNMKEMHEVVGELEKGLEGMDSQAEAAALSTIFGSQSVAGWSAVIDEGSESLEEYTDDLIDSDGAASEMAETMEANGKGAMREFKSALEEAGISISENLIPAFTDIVEKGTDLVRKFGELDDEQQKNIIKWAGIAAAIGPVSMVLGSITTVAGGVIKGLGRISKVIGVASGKGLVARLATMGPAGIAGLTIAGLAGIATAAYKAYQKQDDLHDVNYDVIESMKGEIDATDDMIARFEELEKKNSLSTDEMLRFMDIMDEMERTSNEKTLEKLSDEQEKLLEKSGLTNDEMTEFIGLNDDIVEKSPATAEAISEQGNQYATNLEIIKELNEQQREEMKLKTTGELVKAMENENTLLEEKKDLQSDLKQLGNDVVDTATKSNEKQREINEETLKQEEIASEVNELKDKAKELDGQAGRDAQDKLNKKRDELDEQNKLLIELENEKSKLDKNYDTLQDQVGEKQKGLDKTQEELDKIDTLKSDYEALILSEVGLTAEKGKGIDAIDEEINKLQRSKKELENNTSASEKNTKEYQDQVGEINSQIGKLEGAKGELRDVNKLAGETVYDKEVHVKSVGLGAVNAKIQEEKSKNVRPKLVGMGAVNAKLTEPVTKTVRAVSKGMGAVNRVLRGYATGTDNHPGGEFIAGEKGWELGRMGKHWEVLNFGMYDRPSGYEVFPHQESKRILKAMKNIPAYADGARQQNEANRVVSQMNTTTNNDNLVVDLLRDIASGVRAGKVIQIGDKEITQVTNERNAIDSLGRYF